MVDLLDWANKLYSKLPVHMQYDIDEEEDSGLEPDELPDGYERLKDASISRL